MTESTAAAAAAVTEDRYMLQSPVGVGSVGINQHRQGSGRCAVTRLAELKALEMSIPMITSRSCYYFQRPYVFGPFTGRLLISAPL